MQDLLEHGAENVEDDLLLDAADDGFDDDLGDDLDRDLEFGRASDLYKEHHDQHLNSQSVTAGEKPPQNSNGLNQDKQLTQQFYQTEQ